MQYRHGDGWGDLMPNSFDNNPGGTLLRTEVKCLNGTYGYRVFAEREAGHGNHSYRSKGGPIASISCTAHQGCFVAGPECEAVESVRIPTPVERAAPAVDVPNLLGDGHAYTQ